MTDFKYSQEPWRFEKETRTVRSANNVLLACIDYECPSVEAMRNGLLMASSPILLQALKEALSMDCHSEGVTCRFDEWIQENKDDIEGLTKEELETCLCPTHQMIQDAIDKAEGRI